MMTQTKKDIGSIAMQYADSGLYVFPLATGSKIPKAGSSGWKDASNDPAFVAGLFLSRDNIGCAAGLSGILCLDVDKIEKKTKRNPWWDTLTEDQLASLSTGNHLRTPSGGDQYLFRCKVNEFKSSTSEIAEGVDTKCAGGYFLLPPSETAVGPYLFEMATSPAWMGELAEVPSWLRKKLSKPDDKKKTALLVSASTEEAIKEGGRNTWLTAQAGIMRRQGMEEVGIFNALLEINKAKLNPPLQESEVRTIAKSVSKYEPDQIASAEAGVIGGDVDISGILNMRGAPKFDEYEEPESSWVSDPTATQVSPAPGLMAEMVASMMASAPYPNLQLAIGGAMVALSGIVGRNWSIPRNGRVNLELIVLAVSGAGKDHPRKYIQKLFAELGIQDRLCGDYASKEGLEDHLATNPCAISLKDEADGLLSSLKNQVDGMSKKIWDYRLELFTSSNNSIRTRMKVGKPSVEIHYPFLSVMSSAIPGKYFEALSETAIEKGLVSRSSIIVAGPRGRAQRNPSKIEFSPALLAKLKALATKTPGNLASSGATGFTPFDLGIDQKADDELFAFQNWCDDRFQERIDKGRKTAVLWTRCAELAIKYAALHCFSVHGAKVGMITSDDVKWGTEFSKTCIETVEDRLENVGNESKDQQIFEKILRHVHSAENKTITHRALLQKMRLKSEDLEKYVETLLESRELVSGQRKNKSGKKTIIYSA